MRCKMSGRFTPAAATWMRISFGFGAGTGRSAGVNTSGPPGLAISTARILEGRDMKFSGKCSDDHNAAVTMLILPIKARRECRAAGAGSFDHTIGAQEYRLRNPDADCLRRLEIYDQVELHRLLHRQVGGLGA